MTAGYEYYGHTAVAILARNPGEVGFITAGIKTVADCLVGDMITEDPQPKAVHTLDQVVAQAARLGWTVGITSEDLVGAQCRAVVGLGLAKDEKWRSGQTWSAPGTARLRMHGRTKRPWNACPTAITRRSPWRRSPTAGSTHPISRCSMRRRAL